MENLEEESYNILIKRSKRKSIALIILANGRIEVRAPLKSSTTKIISFVKSKKDWISKNLKTIDKKISFKNKFDFTNFSYILGEKYKEKIKYKDYALNILPKMIKDIAKQINLKYDFIKISSSKRLWGSYSNKNVIMLNYKCIILPKKFIEYIIIHELCHSKEMNHSRKFWKLVESYCPQYRLIKKELSFYDFLLKTAIE